MSSNKNAKIIIQEGRLSKILKINSKTLKQFFTTLSLLVSALIVSMVLTILFYQNQISMVKDDQSSSLDSLTKQNEEKATTISTLTEENLALREKLSQPSEKSSALSLFATPSGFKDITKQGLIKLEEINTSFSNGKANLKFNVKNTKQNGKVSGYSFVSLYTDSGITVQPTSKSLMSGTPIEFQQGESFTVSRFRPFTVNFSIPKSMKEAFFRIVIFSKTGDMITNKLVGPISVNN